MITPDSGAQTAIILGVDLQLVIDKSDTTRFNIRALDAAGNVLALLGGSRDYPTDAEFGAARATALHLFAERVLPPADKPVEMITPPHAYERDRANGWACKWCPLDARHEIHSAPRPATGGTR